jgi:hypothetical protein
MNYGDLLQNIAMRLNRPDLLAVVPPATQAVIPTFVQDRIAFYQKALYSPSEQLDYSITCIPNQSIYAFENYPLLKGVQWIAGVRLLLNNIWIPLSHVDWYSDLLAADVLQPAFVSLPSYWATYGETIRFYPNPDQSYPIELQACLSPPAPVAPTDVSFWTEKAATLIIEAACSDICAAVLNDDERAARHALLTKREADSLQSWTVRLRGASQVRPYL